MAASPPPRNLNRRCAISRRASTSPLCPWILRPRAPKCPCLTTPYLLKPTCTAPQTVRMARPAGAEARRRALLRLLLLLSPLLLAPCLAWVPSTTLGLVSSILRLESTTRFRSIDRPADRSNKTSRLFDDRISSNPHDIHRRARHCNGGSTGGGHHHQRQQYHQQRSPVGAAAAGATGGSRRRRERMSWGTASRRRSAWGRARKWLFMWLGWWVVDAVGAVLNDC